MFLRPVALLILLDLSALKRVGAASEILTEGPWLWCASSLPDSPVPGQAANSVPFFHRAQSLIFHKELSELVYSLHIFSLWTSVRVFHCKQVKRLRIEPKGWKTDSGDGGSEVAYTMPRKLQNPAWKIGTRWGSVVSRTVATGVP